MVKLFPTPPKYPFAPLTGAQQSRLEMRRYPRSVGTHEPQEVGRLFVAGRAGVGAEEQQWHVVHGSHLWLAEALLLQPQTALRGAQSQPTLFGWAPLRGAIAAACCVSVMCLDCELERPRAATVVGKSVKSLPGEMECRLAVSTATMQVNSPQTTSTLGSSSLSPSSYSTRYWAPDATLRATTPGK